MNTRHKLKIQQTIDCYFATLDKNLETRFHGDLTIYGKSFIDMSARYIWGLISYRSTSNPTRDTVEELLESLKTLTNSESLYTEESHEEIDLITLRLTHESWYIYRCEGGGYYIKPLWNNSRKEVYVNLSAWEAAELMIVFDSFMPQIRECSETLIRKNAEKIKICEILRVSAKGIISRLMSEGTIQVEGKTDVTCSTPNKIEVELGNSKWLVTSLEEMEKLLLRRYAQKKNTR